MLTHTRHHYAAELGGPWRTSVADSVPSAKSDVMWCGSDGGARPQVVLKTGGGLRYVSTACKSRSGTMSRNYVREVRGTA